MYVFKNIFRAPWEINLPNQIGLKQDVKSSIFLRLFEEDTSE